MKIKINSNKGMSLATIVISIILMIIILSSIILSVNKTSETKEAMQLNNDIEELKRRVNLYYLQNGVLPIDESEVIYTEAIKNSSDISNTSGNDNTSNSVKYYRLLVSTFENLNLNNQEEIEIKEENGYKREQLIKGYVINKETHLIYYGEINSTNGFQPIKYKYADWYKDFLNKTEISMKQVAETTIDVESGEILTFSISGDKAIVTGLTEYGKSIENLELVIPKYYKGKKVTSIAAKAFQYENKIKSVTAPDTLTMIGANAFEGETYKYKDENGEEKIEYYSNLTNINMKGVTYIDSNAFQNCTKLEGTIDFKTVTNLGKYAFYNCISMKGEADLTNIEEISEFTFYNCASLEKLIITDGTVKIGNEAFNLCSNLTGEANLYGLTQINSRIFKDCQNLNIKVDFSTITTSTIGDRAFVNCDNLDVATDENGYIKLSDSITTINDKAFYSSSISGKLKSDSITTIKIQGFFSCTNIIGELELPNLTAITYGALNYLGITSANLPNVTSIEKNGMRGCANMVSIYMPKVQEIKYGALAGCINLQKVEIPVSCTEMEAYVFNVKPYNEVDVKDDGTTGNPDIKIYCPGNVNKPEGWNENWAYGLDYEGYGGEVLWNQLMPTT